MTMHMIREGDLTRKCYCGRKLAGWKSDNCYDLHYKTAVCDCGCRIRIKVDFMGSGHDNWNTEWFNKPKAEKVTVRTIENIVSQIK